MRKLKTRDIPAFCRCIKRIGAKDKFKEIAMASDTLKDVADRGFDLVWDLFDLATEQEGEKYIYEFLAGPFEMSAEEVGDLDMDVLIENIKHLIHENNLVAFFKFAAAAMK